MINENADAGTKVTFEIYPSIGIARLGNSDSYFIGPEPGWDAAHDMWVTRTTFETETGVEPPETFKYRDDAGNLKRQAARFRIFKCTRDSEDVLQNAEEVRCGEQVQTIRWTVQLRNRKGAAAQFESSSDADRTASNIPLRNSDCKGDQRDSLVIDPGPRTLHVGIGMAGETRAVFDTGAFGGRSVYLGEIRAEPSSDRLLVLGGKGNSFATSPSRPLGNFADNDGWCDDTSDGPVTAKIVLKDGHEIDAEPSWVVVAPPDYAPGISSFVTLYDVCHQAWMDRKGLEPLETNFYSDVLPILRRVRGYRWVFAGVMRSEVPDKHGSWSDESSKLFAALAEPSNNAPAPGSVSERAIRTRQMLFAHLRDPQNDAPPREVAMPRLHDDVKKKTDATEDNSPPRESEVLALTRCQYWHMRNWANGTFSKNRNPPHEFECEALDRIVLQACSGGPFFPGMEVSRIMKDMRLYKARFRIDPCSEIWCGESTETNCPASHMDGGAGRVTEGLAVPWQADFYECRMDGDATWWPATHPDKVLVVRYADPNHKNLDRPADVLSEQMELWHFGVNGRGEMVNKWTRLGFVRAKRLTRDAGWRIPETAEDIRRDEEGEIISGTVYVEQERIEGGDGDGNSLGPRRKSADGEKDDKDLPDRPSEPRTIRANEKRPKASQP
ncbi:conserved hypothetical protein (plasmid) [Paraburkholderia atlantica]|uniref:L-lysine 6-oxidase n=1 Tax=Paraburkholderia atlantica TaxID=2654982 RepID=D5WNI4_PARAM|nr:LodA/GoxA family CTQ-dependent oxidase [Paraburkholderia atlantica]ADG20863.1 conserved hypothetical protein [Paraburkholderia atlantica]